MLTKGNRACGYRVLRTGHCLNPGGHLTVTLLICRSLLKGHALSTANTSGPQDEAPVGKEEFHPGSRVCGPQADAGKGREGGRIKRDRRFPLLSRKLWIICRSFFAEVNQIYRSLAATPSPKCPANPERTLGRYQDRGSPRFPALPTPRDSDIRGSRGLIMQQARRRACVRGEPGLRAEAWQH